VAKSFNMNFGSLFGAVREQRVRPSNWYIGPQDHRASHPRRRLRPGTRRRPLPRLQERGLAPHGRGPDRRCVLSIRGARRALMSALAFPSPSGG
jgi:hypothetical protein